MQPWLKAALAAGKRLYNNMRKMGRVEKGRSLRRALDYFANGLF
jgi:hypothetical protein